MKNFEEKIGESIEDSIELNHLKKINKKINLLRSIIFIILFIILVGLLILFIRYQKSNRIIKKTYNNLQSLSLSDNYKIIKETTDIDYRTKNITQTKNTYFYKDGKYKVVFSVTDNTDFITIPYSTTQYLEDDSYSSIIIFDNLKTVEKRTSNCIEIKKGELFRTFSNIYSYGSLNGLAGIYIKLGLSVRTDYFNGEECYVIRAQSSDYGFRDTWISKEKLVTVREVDTYSDVYYRETIYTLVFNETTDEDVDSSNIDKTYSEYTIKEIDLNVDSTYYELVRKSD